MRVPSLTSVMEPVQGASYIAHKTKNKHLYIVCMRPCIYPGLARHGQVPMHKYWRMLQLIFMDSVFSFSPHEALADQDKTSDTSMRKEAHCAFQTLLKGSNVFLEDS